MLIWLNGAHGAGKTKAARRIATIRPESWLLDPEQIGFMLRRAWPGEMPDDFKDLPAWRTLTLAMLQAAAEEAQGRLVVVPMTLANAAHFDEIVGGLRLAGVDLRHFTLTADPETLRRRLRRRIDWPASRKWALSRVETVSAALAGERFATHVPTDALTVEQVAETVLREAER